MIVIRKLRAKEIPAFAAFTNELTDLHKKLNPKYFETKPDTDAIFAKYIRKHLKDKKYLFLVALDEKNFIGYTMAEIDKRPSIFVREKIGELMDVYVKPSYRRKGIGKKLLAEALKFFKKHKVKQVELMVYSKNKKTMPFYKSLGFKEAWKRMRLALK